MDGLKEVRNEIEVIQVSILEGINNNFQELTEINNVLDELQQNRKLIIEIKESIPTKIPKHSAIYQ